jgi:DNA polymerase-3 subunit delta
LQLINELINLNEPPLRIIATLVAQFRTWTIVKLMLEKGDKNEQEIAVAAEMGNPKRIYFLKKEIKGVSGEQLLGTFPLLLQIELGLKKGADPLMIFETKIIEIIKLLVLKN